MAKGSKASIVGFLGDIHPIHADDHGITTWGDDKDIVPPLGTAERPPIAKGVPLSWDQQRNGRIDGPTIEEEQGDVRFLDADVKGERGKDHEDAGDETAKVARPTHTGQQTEEGAG